MNTMHEKLRAVHQKVVEACAAHNGVDPREVMSGDIHMHVTRARHEAIWIMRTATNLTLAQIGQLFGRRASNVMLGERRIERLIHHNPAERRRLEAFAAKVRDKL